MLQGHRDLKVYQLAYKLAMEIFHLSKHFPREELYSLRIRFGVLREAWPRMSLKDFENDVIQTCWSTSSPILMVKRLRRRFG